MYSVQTLGFISTSIIAPRFIYRFNLSGVVITTQCVQALATIVVGPSEVLKLPEIIWIMITGLLIAGLSSPFCLIPPFKEMESCLEAYPDKKFNPDKVKGIISALFSASIAMGGIIGPIFGAAVC
jgi:hypothetical protein